MERRPRVLVSACLLGVDCRYDGAGSPMPQLDELLARCEVIPVCPEQLGGLPTPRTPAEQREGRVVTRDGADVTDAFRRGASQALRLAQRFGARHALLKARSPSCGSRGVYDGSFSGRVVPGIGIASAVLSDAGIAVFDETELDALFDALKGNTV